MRFDVKDWNSERKCVEAAIKLAKKATRRACPSSGDYQHLHWLKSAATSLYAVRALSRHRVHPGADMEAAAELLQAYMLPDEPVTEAFSA